MKFPTFIIYSMVNVNLHGSRSVFEVFFFMVSINVWLGVEYGSDIFSKEFLATKKVEICLDIDMIPNIVFTSVGFISIFSDIGILEDCNDFITD